MNHEPPAFSYLAAIALAVGAWAMIIVCVDFLMGWK